MAHQSIVMDVCILRSFINFSFTLFFNLGQLVNDPSRQIRGSFETLIVNGVPLFSLLFRFLSQDQRFI